MSKHFICTAGTSILGSSSKILQGETDCRCIVRERLDKLEENSDFLKMLSAETNSLQSLKAGKGDIVSLLVTDTDRGRECAAELEKVISKYLCCKVDSKVIEGLQVQDAKIFRSRGISNLFETVGNLRRLHPIDTQLNVTGGFKSVVPYIALYGLFYGIDVVYLFEFSEDHIILPPAPLGVDFEKAGKLRTFLIKLREEGLLPRSEFVKEIEGFPYYEKPWYQSLVCEEEGYVYLSAFGQLIVESAQENKLQVFLSSSARKALEKSSGLSEKRLHSILLKIGEPLWRGSHIDSGWDITDLVVVKPGNVEERGAYFIKSGSVFMCELYTDHEEYERHLRTRRIKDYSEIDFTQYLPTSDEISYELSFDKDYDQILQEREEIADKCSRLENKIDEIERKWINLDDKRKALEVELSHSNQQKNILGTTLNDLEESYLKRLKFLFTGEYS